LYVKEFGESGEFLSLSPELDEAIAVAELAAPN
jgi:hypothetical protein